MLLSTFKIGLILTVCKIVTAEHPLQLTTTLLKGLPNDMNTAPFIKLGEKLYYFGLEKMNRYNASVTCGSMGGSLASLNDANELQILSNFLIAKYDIKNWWWLSGSDLHEENNFVWYGTSEPFKFSDWSNFQPDNAGGNENCVHLWHQTTKFQMNDWDCKQPAYFICEARPKTVALTFW